MGMLVLAMLGCATEAPPAARSPAEGPTWHRDVAPIVAAECAACHVTGGIAPFALGTYGEASAYADAIATSVTERRMPPFNLDNSGDCGTFSDARWLSDAEIATFTAWARAGAPEGTPAGAAPVAQPAWRLDRVDATLAMAEPYTPDPAVADDYRCLLVDPALVEDRFITGFEARLGAPTMVHHLTLFALDTEEDEREAERLDAAEAGPGYACFGDTVVPSRWLVGAGPGDPGRDFPQGTGPRMRAGRKALLQMHYNTAQGAVPDQTAIDLRLERSVLHEAELERIAVTDLELPPGQPEVVQSKSITLGADYYVWGLWPHMHDLGRTLRVTARSGGEERCLARVDDYRFHWQGFVFYEAPMVVTEGEELTVTCSWDTTSRATTTHWGEATQDEMCIGFFYVTKR